MRVPDTVRREDVSNALRLLGFEPNDIRSFSCDLNTLTVELVAYDSNGGRHIQGNDIVTNFVEVRLSV